MRLFLIILAIVVAFLISEHVHAYPGATNIPTKHQYGKINPRLVVLHSTDGSLRRHSTARYLQRNKRQVAYHLIIERSGEVVQLAKLTRRVNHAGESKWRGRSNVSDFSIGLSLVGPGELFGNTRRARSGAGEIFKHGLFRAKPKNGNRSFIWLPYTAAQKRSLRRVVSYINRRFPGIEYASHGEVAPRRKIDQVPRGLVLASLRQPTLVRKPVMLASMPKLHRPVKVKKRAKPRRKFWKKPRRYRTKRKRVRFASRYKKRRMALGRKPRVKRYKRRESWGNSYWQKRLNYRR